MSADNFPVMLADYSDLTLDVPPVQSVTQDLVLSRLVDMQYQLAEAREVKRPVRKGDRVVMDLYAVSAGVPVPGSLQTDLQSLVREDMLMPGFASQLLGMLPGQKKDFRLTFPEHIEIADYVGKTATYTVHLKQLFELSVPKLDEHFPQRTGQVETMPDLLQLIAQDLQDEFETDWRRFVTQLLVEGLVTSSRLELSPELIDTELENTWNQSEGETYREWGLPESFLKKSLEAWQAAPELRQAAEMRLRTTLVLHALAMQEDLGVTPDELTIALQPFSQSFHQPVEAIYQELVDSDRIQTLLLQLEAEKAADFLFKRARFVFEGQLLTA